MEVESHGILLFSASHAIALVEYGYRCLVSLFCFDFPCIFVLPFFSLNDCYQKLISINIDLTYSMKDCAFICLMFVDDKIIF